MSSRFQRGRLGVPVLRLLATAAVIAAGVGISVISDAASSTRHALGELGISVEPARGVTASPWLVYEVDPGRAISDDFIVSNESSTARSLDLYAADARTLPSGAFEADLKEVRPNELGAWTRLDVSHIDLLPRTNRRVHLTVAVPRGADPGEYEGSVLAQFVTADQQQVRIVHRIGLRVYLTVKGEVIESGRIDSVASAHWWERGWPGDPVDLRTNFVNTGNVHLRVLGSATAGGSTASLTEGGAENVVPRHASLALVTPWRSHPWIGVQQVHVDARYSNHRTTHALADTRVWFIPWKAILLGLALLTFFAYVGRRVVLWLRRSQTLAVTVRGTTMRMTVVDPTEHPEGLPSPPTGSDLIVVALQVLNKGPKPLRFVVGRFQLLDAQNRPFGADSTASALLEDELDPVVPPGGRTVLALAFVMPKGVKPRAGIYRSDGGNLIAEMVPWQVG